MILLIIPAMFPPSTVMNKLMFHELFLEFISSKIKGCALNKIPLMKTKQTVGNPFAKPILQQIFEKLIKPNYKMKKIKLRKDLTINNIY